jgi:hypothetical protein
LKGRLIALTVLLAVALGAIAWQARIRWNEAKAKREANLKSHVKPVAALRPAPAPEPEAVPATHYTEVATKNLFSKDRNPDVIVDPPKVEAPKPMPPLPIVYGVLGLPSGTRALMSEKAGEASKPVRVGETIGEFKVIALDQQNVTFDWDGKEIRRKVEDLADRSAAAAGAPQGPAIAQPAPQRAPAQSSASFQASQQPTQQTNQPTQQGGEGGVMGVEVGAPGQSRRACRPGDSSPAGTVADGYRKSLTATPFGATCQWVPAQ